MNHKNQTNSYTEFFYKAFRNILLISVPLTIISAAILSSLHSSATGSTSGSDNLAITISSSCTLSSVVNIPHNAEVYNGNYLGDIGKTTITTLCNDGNGYSVYAVGYSNNEEGNNKLINTDPSYSNHSIETGLNTSGLTSAWAMKLNSVDSIVSGEGDSITTIPASTPPTIESDYNNVYGIIPPYWTKVAGRQSGTTDMAEGSSFTTTYAVYASSSQYAGTYQGQVKYLLTHPATQNSQLFMQDVVAIKNNLSNVGDSMQVVDQRDGKFYWVTRLADGHIWMTQNLDFDINSNTTLDSTTTDLSVIYNSSTGQYAEYDTGYTENNGTIYWTPTSSATTINFEGVRATNWFGSKTAPVSASKTDNIEAGHESLGNYYNWTAAIASNDSSSFTTSTYDNIASNPQNSICPKGWRLPTISNQRSTIQDSTNEFARLNYLYNGGLTNTDVGLMASPTYFKYAGVIDSKSNNILTAPEGLGLYISSTNYGPSGFYGMQFSPNKILIEEFNVNYDGKKSGFSIRCVAR